MRSRIDIRREEGQTMVEFAIVLPVLCLLLFGIIQFGILFNNYLTLTDAVRAGARKAAVSGPLGAAGATAATTQAVKDSASDLDQSKLTPINVTSTWDHGDGVTVHAEYPYSIDLMGLIKIADGRLTSTTTERVE
jgi:Flp pilus assembly protein TadG